VVRAHERRGPVRVAPSVQRVGEPTREEESGRRGDGGVWEHGRQDREQLGLHFGVGEGLDSLRVIALRYTVRKQGRAVNGRAYGYSGEDNSGAREEAFEVEALPDGVPPAFRVRVQSKLASRQMLRGEATANEDTWVSNQNLSSNWRNILVYVACRSSVQKP
jgi:hypothetical protein